MNTNTSAKEKNFARIKASADIIQRSVTNIVADYEHRNEACAIKQNQIDDIDWNIRRINREQLQIRDALRAWGKS